LDLGIFLELKREIWMISEMMKYESEGPGRSHSLAGIWNAFQQQQLLWHNDAKGEPVNKLFPNSSANKRLYLPTLRRCALAAIAAIIVPELFGIALGRAQTSAPPKEKTEMVLTGNAEAGKKIFTKDGCYECHGHEGQGAAQGAGPRIGPPLLSQEAVMKYVRQPSGQMPPYTSKVISDQELADIFAYLQSRPKGTPGKDIPLLN
jgi:mono/diheme cytochrome c family protein